MITDRIIVDWLVQRFEGGFSHHPADRGGATNFGCSQKFLSAAWGRPVSVEEVRALTRSEAVTVLREHFVLRPRIAEIEDPHTRLVVIDFAIHSGADTAIRGVQSVRGVGRDGRWGPVTREAVRSARQEWLRTDLLAYRLRLLGRFVARNPDQAAFIGGWTGRVATLLEIHSIESVLG